MAQYKGAAKEASRAMNLLKKRQKEREELELRKKKIEEDSKVKIAFDPINVLLIHQTFFR